MVGAKMASLEVGDNQHTIKGCSIEQASKLCKVGISSIVRARKVLGFGDPETIQRVAAGNLSVSKAAAQAASQARAEEDGDDEDEDEDTADVEVLAEYDNLEGKLLIKLSDLNAAKAAEHSEITISKIKTQVGIMKKAAEKAAAKAVKGKAT
jgi:MoxR-like ATPase